MTKEDASHSLTKKTMATLVVLQITQLSVSEHFICKLVPPLTSLVGGLYVLYIVFDSSRVG